VRGIVVIYGGAAPVKTMLMGQVQRPRDRGLKERQTAALQTN